MIARLGPCGTCLAGVVMQRRIPSVSGRSIPSLHYMRWPCGFLGAPAGLGNLSGRTRLNLGFCGSPCTSAERTSLHDDRQIGALGYLHGCWCSASVDYVSVSVLKHFTPCHATNTIVGTPEPLRTRVYGYGRKGT
ncbi:unnamed protein product [Allacma fusca]|uniref:Uncharacterized protein n=1 Tax=Allacma fusca TaxID=39272 RepID=A0A8J2PSB4_9HEXA|nr:unnamed protein product [Allacma fusca]